MKVLHNGCNTVTRALPDMFTLSPRAEDGLAMDDMPCHGYVHPQPSALGPVALGFWVYISGRALMPVLQLLNIYVQESYSICI